MSIKTFETYAVTCDHPGCTYETKDFNDEYSGFDYESYAVEDWTNGDHQAVTNDDGTQSHYCFDHRVPACIHCDRRATLTAIGTGLICGTCQAS